MNNFDEKFKKIIDEQENLVNSFMNVHLQNNIKIINNFYKPKIPDNVLNMQKLTNSFKPQILNQNIFINSDKIMPFQNMINDLKQIKNLSLQSNLNKLIEQIGYPGNKLSKLQNSNVEFLNHSDEFKQLFSKEISDDGNYSTSINNKFKSDIISDIYIKDSFNRNPTIEEETTDQSNKSSRNEIQKETKTSFHSSQLFLWLTVLLGINDQITNIREIPNNIGFINDLINQLLILINQHFK